MRFMSVRKHCSPVRCGMEDSAGWKWLYELIFILPCLIGWKGGSFYLLQSIVSYCWLKGCIPSVWIDGQRFCYYSSAMFFPEDATWKVVSSGCRGASGCVCLLKLESLALRLAVGLACQSLMCQCGILIGRYLIWEDKMLRSSKTVSIVTKGRTWRDCPGIDAGPSQQEPGT
jgi:hypothetical protein